MEVTMRKQFLLSTAIIVLAFGGGAIAQTRQSPGSEQGTPSVVQGQSSTDVQRPEVNSNVQTGEGAERREGRDNRRMGGQEGHRDQGTGERQDRRDYGERNEGQRDETRRDRQTVGRTSDDNYRSDRDYNRDDRRFEDRGRYEGRERFGDRYEERGRYGERRSYDRRYGRLERGYEDRSDYRITRRQRARIHDVLVQRRVQPANIDFPIRIGEQIPSYVELYDLPQEAYYWAPRFQGYRYFETEDNIVIIDPQTMEVVAVLDQ